MKSIHLNKQTFRDGAGRTARWVAEVPYVLLIQRFMMVRLVLLVGLLLVALWAIVALLYLSPNAAVVSGKERPLVLQTEIIDELEVWLEDREDEHQRTIMGTSRDYFAK